jgi:hypothetical protein
MEVLECPICMDNISTMILAPCSHSFCESCCEKIMAGSQICYECRQEVVFIVKNRILLRLWEAYNNIIVINDPNNNNNNNNNNNGITDIKVKMMTGRCNHIYTKGNKKGEQCHINVDMNNRFCSSHKNLVCNK